MPGQLIETLERLQIVPLVEADSPRQALSISQALLDGGLEVLEVVLRTDAAFDCLAAICEKYPDVQVGAGTVLSQMQARKAVECGAKFIVSPGLNEGVMNVADAGGIPVIPGISTATELQRAWNLDLRTVKFFPASLAGGVPMLKALSSVFRDVRFMPTGGVNAASLKEFLAVPSVLACGGSWLTPKDVIAGGDFGAVSELARAALAAAREAKQVAKANRTKN